MRAPIERLWCLHWPVTCPPGEEPDAGLVARLRTSGVYLETCLRRLAFGLGDVPVQAAGTALCTGADAWRLILEVASGLRSAVPGETNVFGQFRRAWEQAAVALPPSIAHELAPVVDALVADTRRLRASHLQGMAGNSYGSLVRALLAPRRDARLLFVGTGELARSMLPLFRSWDAGVWNHRPGPPLAGICRWFAPDEADLAADWATDVIFTTPADAGHDSDWHLRLGRTNLRGVVHLGRRRGEGPGWPTAAASYDLDDVFALAGARDKQRARQLADAMLACEALVAGRVGDARLVQRA